MRADLSVHVDRVRDAWVARTPRERLMLTVMGAALGAFALWFGLVSPTLTWRRDAMDRHLQAALAQATVHAAGQSSTAGDVVSAQTRVARLAKEHGLDAAIAVAGDQVEVRIEAAPAQHLFGWIAALEANQIALRSLSVLENADATVQAEIAMVSNARS